MKEVNSGTLHGLAVLAWGREGGGARGGPQPKGGAKQYT